MVIFASILYCRVGLRMHKAQARAMLLDFLCLKQQCAFCRFYA